MRENCIVCGAELIYSAEQKEKRCDICGKAVMSNAECRNGHFVCDECHEKGADGTIREVCIASVSRDPFEIFFEIMDKPIIHMHGPEHHMAVGAALFTAYKNCVITEKSIANDRAFMKNLDELLRRGSEVPGGTCGFWGICGAAVSTGIFYSIISRTTPLAARHWSNIQKGAAASLEKIAEYPGPRCCKRTSLLSIKAAIEYTKEYFGVKMEGGDEKITCDHFFRNRECIGPECPFFDK